MLEEDEILNIYSSRNAIWLFDYRRGDPTQPHAVLTSGRHSDGYINSTLVMQDPQLVELLARELAEHLRRRNALPVEWVVGSPYAAITFSFEVARQISAKHGFAEKNPWYDESRRDREAPFIWRRFVIPEGARVLLVEELITTIGTVFDVRRAIEKDNPHRVFFSPDIATAVFRPETDTNPMALGDLICLVKRIIRTWNPEECPLCRQGSRTIRPKPQWAELAGKKRGQ